MYMLWGPTPPDLPPGCDPQRPLPRTDPPPVSPHIITNRDPPPPYSGVPQDQPSKPHTVTHRDPSVLGLLQDSLPNPPHATTKKPFGTMGCYGVPQDQTSPLPPILPVLPYAVTHRDPSQLGVPQD